MVFLSIDADEERNLVAPFLESQQWSKQRVYFEDGSERRVTVSSIPTTIVSARRAAWRAA